MKALRRIGRATAAILVFAAVLQVQAEPSRGEREQQERCPVMGGKINRNHYVDVQGKRVYVCCPGCIDKIKADPAKYIRKLEDQGVEVEQAPKPQTHCPVMGGKINKAQYIDVHGKRIYVCCPGCIPTIKKTPGKYIEKLEKQGITLETVTERKGTDRKGHGDRHKGEGRKNHDGRH